MARYRNEQKIMWFGYIMAVFFFVIILLAIYHLVQTTKRIPQETLDSVCENIMGDGAFYTDKVFYSGSQNDFVCKNDNLILIVNQDGFTVEESK